jgi:hypothetical protein
MIELVFLSLAVVVISPLSALSYLLMGETFFSWSVLFSAFADVV